MKIGFGCTKKLRLEFLFGAIQMHMFGYDKINSRKYPSILDVYRKKSKMYYS
jgi:hypothetical protein